MRVHDMEKVLLGCYSGRENRGTEAIAFSTTDLFHKYGIKSCINFKSESNIEESGKSFFDGYVANRSINSTALKMFNGAWRRVFNNTYVYNFFRYADVLDKANNSVIIHMGGDTYCYGTSFDNNAFVYLAKKKQIPIVLWGVSLEKECLSNHLTMKALRKYDKIYVRESLSYDLLLDYGFDSSKLFSMSDPAFSLEMKDVALESDWWSKRVIGINLSPFAMSENDNSMLVIYSCIKLIDNLLNNSDFNIALIPHVWTGDNQGDYVPLNIIKKAFSQNKRVKIIQGDYSCRELKYIISRCYALLATRTHASIAAYSSFVPTLVLGYSIKSKGIANDLFGNYENFVLPIKNIQSEDQIINSFMKIIDNHDLISNSLKDSIPEYSQRALQATEDIIKSFM